MDRTDRGALTPEQVVETGAPLTPSATADYLVRSEERLKVHTVKVPYRKARLVKFTVTETKTVEVQVTREDVRLEYVDMDDSGTPPGDGEEIRPEDMTGTDELILYSETPEVHLVKVPTERARLRVVTVDGVKEIVEDVRIEKIDDVAVDRTAPSAHT